MTAVWINKSNPSHYFVARDKAEAEKRINEENEGMEVKYEGDIVQSPEHLASTVDMKWINAAYEEITGEAPKRSADLQSHARKVWKVFENNLPVEIEPVKPEEPKEPKAPKAKKGKKGKEPKAKKEKAPKKSNNRDLPMWAVEERHSPFKPSSWNGRTWQLILDNPGLTYRELEALKTANCPDGGRPQALAYVIREKLVTFVAPKAETEEDKGAGE